MQLPDHLSGGDVQRSKQRWSCRDARSRGSAARECPGQRQRQLGAVQGLDLVFVHAQNERLQWRIQIQPHDVAHLVHEHRVAGQPRSLLAMGLQTRRRARYARRQSASAHLARHRASAPVGRCRRRASKVLAITRVSSGIVDRARRAAAWRVQQSIEPVLDVASPPFAHSLLRYRWRAATALFSRHRHKPARSELAAPGACAVLRRNVSACRVRSARSGLSTSSPLALRPLQPRLPRTVRWTPVRTNGSTNF